MTLAPGGALGRDRLLAAGGVLGLARERLRFRPRLRHRGAMVGDVGARERQLVLQGRGRNQRQRSPPAPRSAGRSPRYAPQAGACALPPAPRAARSAARARARRRHGRHGRRRRARCRSRQSTRACTSTPAAVTASASASSTARRRAAAASFGLGKLAPGCRRAGSSRRGGAPRRSAHARPPCSRPSARDRLRATPAAARSSAQRRDADRRRARRCRSAPGGAPARLAPLTCADSATAPIGNAGSLGSTAAPLQRSGAEASIGALRSSPKAAPSAASNPFSTVRRSSDRRPHAGGIGLQQLGQRARFGLELRHAPLGIGQRRARRLIGLARRDMLRLGILRRRLGFRHRALRRFDRGGERLDVGPAARFGFQPRLLVLDRGDLALGARQALGIVADRALKLAAPRREIGERLGALGENLLGLRQRRLGGRRPSRQPRRRARPSSRRPA